MKRDNRTPTQQSDLTLMNARRREKKALVQARRHPSCTSEFVALGEEIKKWFAENKGASSLISGLHKLNLTWTQIKKWRSESEVFNTYIEECLQLCQTRREEYLHAEGKLSQIYLREHPLYVPMLGEYEKELKDKGQQGTDRIVILPQIPTPKEE